MAFSHQAKAIIIDGYCKNQLHQRNISRSLSPGVNIPETLLTIGAHSASLDSRVLTDVKQKMLPARFMKAVNDLIQSVDDTYR